MIPILQLTVFLLELTYGGSHALKQVQRRSVTNALSIKTAKKVSPSVAKRSSLHRRFGVAYFGRPYPTSESSFAPATRYQNAMENFWKPRRNTRQVLTNVASEGASIELRDDKKRNQGRLMLVGVAGLYGALTVVLRSLTLMEGPPVASLLSTVRGAIAATCFLPSLASFLNQGKKLSKSQWAGVIEMALYNLGAQGFLALGIYHTDATRAAFFTQASVILTPVISRLSGERVPVSMWIGASIAMAGVSLLGMTGAFTAAAAGFNIGDILCLAGAVSWSLYICRMGAIMNRGLSPIVLQTFKTITLMFLYALWAFVALKTSGLSLLAAWPGYKNLSQWLLIAFSAIGPGALADWAQSVGQKTVSSSEANIILCSEPLFSALLAFVMLQERIAGPGLVGAGMIFVAALVASGIFEKPSTAQSS